MGIVNRTDEKDLTAVTTRWFMIALLLLAFGLRLHRAGDRSVWWDEGWSVWVARQSPAEILYETGHDVHPPLYFWLLHSWREVSGDSEWGLRALSAIWGTLTVAATYLLGRIVASRKVGLLAALFVTLSRFSIVWSQEIRMYALASLLAVLGLWAAVRVWDRGRPFDYALYILFMTVGLLTLYMFFPVPVAANVAWLWVFWHSRRRKEALIKWAAAQVMILIIIGAWLSYALGGFLSTVSAAPIAMIDFLKIYWTVLVVGIPLNVDTYARYTIPVLLIFFAAVAALIWGARRDWHMARHLTMFLTGLLLPIAVVYYVTLPKVGTYSPPFSPRYLVIFSGYYSILLAWGILCLGQGRRWLLSPLLSLVVILAALVGMRGYYQGRRLIDDYKSLTATVQAYAREEDAVLLYTDRDWPVFDYHLAQEWRGVPHLWNVIPEVADDYLAPIWEEHEGVWLVVTPYAGITDPQGHLLDWLAERATAVTSISYGDKALHFYARTPERAATMSDLAPGVVPRYEQTAVVAPSTTLIGYDQAVHDFAFGDTAHLFLYWQKDNGTAVTEVGIMDRAGEWGWGTGLDIPAETPRQQVDLIIPPEAPTGEYTFYLLDDRGKMRRFGELKVRGQGTAVLTAADVDIANRLEADFANGIQLLGYDVETKSPQPGEALHLTLYWLSDEPITQRYKVFTHLLGDVFNGETENFLWGQQDNEPVNASRPTTTWRTGEVIVDSYAIPIAPHAPSSEYRIEIGLYDPATGARLGIIGENGTAVSDHLILTTITLP